MLKDEEKRKICETMIYLMDPYRIEAMKRYFPEIGRNKALTNKSCELADQVEALAIIYAAGIIDSLVFIKERGLLDKVFRCM